MEGYRQNVNQVRPKGIFVLIMSLFMMTLSTSVQGQSVPKLIEIADDLFESERYLEAIEFYDKIVKLDKTNDKALFRLAICYNQTLKYEQAQETFLRLGRKQGSEYRARALYYYSVIQKLDSKYEVADSLFTFLISLPDAEPELIELSQRQKEGCLLALRQQNVQRGYEVHAFDDINSQYHDFGGTRNPNNGHVVFASTRVAHGDQYVGSQFIGVLPDLLAFNKQRNGNWRESTNQGKFSVVNTEWSEGSGTFTGDGKKFYFSSCSGEGGSDCRIMFTELVDGTWTKPAPLNEYVNEPGSENKQPSVSATGDTLFFVSNRIGGAGGSDIWMSLQGFEPESWAPAINLGEVVNTSGNEITPYFSSAFQALVFASNGHIGYGGYDSYLAKGESFFEPEIYNLGDPFNSSHDDIYFNISDTIGFLSSNRDKERILDLNYFRVSDEKLFLSLLISGESLIDSRIISRFKDVKLLDLFTFRAEDYEGYELFDPEKREKPKPKIIQEAIAEEEAEEEVAVQEDSLQVVASELEEREEPEMTVAERQRLIDQQKFITHSEAGTVSARNADGFYEHNFEKIYFFYGTSQLTTSGKKSLDALVAQLSERAYESVDILAYSNPKAAEKGNVALSRERGRLVVEYLVNAGIPREQIRLLERGLKVDEVRDHWYARVFSRKVEVHVNAESPKGLAKANSYLVREDLPVDRIATLLNVNKQDLLAWNGFRKDVVKAGTIIRVYGGREYPSLRYFADEFDAQNTFFKYRVKSGETLESIARKYNTMEELLMEVNEVILPLTIGQKIFIYQIN